MKALVKTQKGDGFIQVMERPYPVLPAQDWVIIRVAAAGVCGTDLHIWHDQFPYWPPVILGHEFSGEIVETGSAVKKFAVGDRVVCEPHSLACGECELCRTGRIQQCTDKRSPGWGIDGGFAEYVTMPAKLLHRIPDGVSYDIAALAEPLAITVHHVTEICGISFRDFVVVSGAGPMGILATFVAKAAGARTVVTTGLSKCEGIRFPAALKLGADRTVNVEKEDVAAVVAELSDGKGADVVIETSGAGSAISAAVSVLKKYGKLCAVGMSGDKAQIPWKDIVMKSLTVYGCFSSGYTAWDKALSLMAETGRQLDAVITHRVNLGEWEGTFRDLEAENGIKALFLMNGTEAGR